MIITDKFVFIHQPKTGGTFVTEVLKRIHAARAGRALLPLPENWRLRRAGFIYAKSNNAKHARCDDIPEPHRSKPIVACVRNPYSRYISQYNFLWWARNRKVDVEKMRKRFPQFPKFTFEEYLDYVFQMMPVKNTQFPPERALGMQTWQFLRQFCRKPRQVFPAIDENYLAARRWERDLYPVRFLHTDSLNQELHDFLISVGYEPAEVQFVLTEGKILPPGGLRSDRPWQSYYTPELKQVVRTRERLLFDIFPEFDV
jgi:hypothetical protein